MSRWSAERLRIALSPGEAALLRGENTLRLGVPERAVAALLSPLAEALADPDWQGRRVDVVLSQHFVRHVLTPPPGAALARAEERALVAASLREIYGDEAGSWRVEVHSQPPRYGLFGAAVDAAFVQALDALLAQRGFRDVTIRPLSVAAARRLPPRFEGWWALVEPGWMSLFGLGRGAWQSVAALPVDDAWRDALVEFTAREAGTVQPRVCIQPVGVGAVALPADAPAAWQVLRHDEQAVGAVALAGI